MGAQDNLWGDGQDGPSSTSRLSTEKAAAIIVLGAVLFLFGVNRGFARVLPRFGSGGG